MKKIVHLSDLHFGRVNPDTLEPLQKIIQTLAPDLIVISGDLTQRARLSEYREAGQFVHELAKPLLIVPGNHDVPVYNVLARLLWPRRWYKKYVHENLQPQYSDEEISVIGLNTTRVLQIKNGRIGPRQLSAVEKLFEKNPDTVKIVVTHHPFVVPRHAQQPQLPVAGGKQAILEMEHLQPDIFLSGHLHVSNIANTAEQFQLQNYSSLLVQAGTATSARYRKEVNAFNVLSVDRRDITIHRYAWRPRERRFKQIKTENFSHSVSGWKKV